jgi:hypothetical protein
VITLYPVDHGFDERCGFAGAWTGQHEQGAASMFDDLPLRLVKLWR